MIRSGPPVPSALRPGLAAAGAVGCGLTALKLLPGLELKLFARGAAGLASLFTGQPVARVENGWMLPDANLPIVVTQACSATDFFLIIAALVAWRLAARGLTVGGALVSGLAVALPLSIFINALRVVVVARAHRWFIDRFPQSYGPFLHMATGVAVFLPSLIALNVLLDLRPFRRSATPA